MENASEEAFNAHEYQGFTVGKSRPKTPVG
jgi:hypothetical protein